MSYAFWADVVVALHVGYVGFVVVGELAILLGALCGWRWVRNPRFRIIHLLAIGIVATEALFNVTCPLTTLESTLREWANQPVEQGSFVGRLFHYTLWGAFFPDQEPGFFRWLHMGFGGLVLATLLLIPPRWERLRSEREEEVLGSEAATS